MSLDTAPARDTPIATLSELVLVIRRDGVILQHNAVQLAGLELAGDCIGRSVDSLWAERPAAVLRQLTRRAITLRSKTEVSFEEGRRRYHLHASAQGPDRAVCTIRLMLATPAEARHATAATRGWHPERRGFLRRLKESISVAALRERPIAVAVIYVDGIVDIAQVIDQRVADQIMSAALQRLPPAAGDAAGAEPPWCVGQLSDGVLAVVVESGDREAIERCLSQVCESLREPVAIRGSVFHLTPYAGVAILGQDASAPKMLLKHGRRAATEARSTGSDAICFFADTLKLESLARLDIARELRDAIVSGQIHLRYVGRHELASGRLVARVGYLYWHHPLRGEIRPVEFLRVAETTGLAIALSRAVLARLPQDYSALKVRGDARACISFGALRHHVLHESFVADIEALLDQGVIPARQLELRISERTLLGCEPSVLDSLQRLGLRLVVDEVARGLGSLDRLARAPIWGLQLDRAWVTALRGVEADPSEVALKVCRAAIGLAKALGLTPIATGVDTSARRDSLLALGCAYGSGDLYRPAET